MKTSIQHCNKFDDFDTSFEHALLMMIKNMFLEKGQGHKNWFNKIFLCVFNVSKFNLTYCSIFFSFSQVFCCYTIQFNSGVVYLISQNKFENGLGGLT